MFDQHRLRDDGTNAARPQEASERSDDMNEKDDEITHLLILTKPGIAWGCVTN